MRAPSCSWITAEVKVRSPWLPRWLGEPLSPSLARSRGWQEPLLLGELHDEIVQGQVMTADCSSRSGGVACTWCRK